MSKAASRRQLRCTAGGWLCQPEGPTADRRVAAVKEGAHGGTTGSPMKDVRFLDV
jgi:hypothetical protein